MSDTKRILVWLFVLVWCVLSLAFDVRAQGTIDLSPLPEFTEQRCGEPLEVAANTIIIKKKAVSASGGGGACTLWKDYQTTADYDNIYEVLNHTYSGQSDFDPGDADVTVCQVDFYVRQISGAAQTWICEIHLMNGTAITAAPVTGGTSSGTLVSGAGIASFTGLSALLDNTKTYAIVVTRAEHTYDETNNIQIYHGGGDLGLSGSFYYWYGDDYSRNGANPGDTSMRIWTVQ